MTWNRNIPGLLTDDIRLGVPLDHNNPEDLRTVEIYARLVAAPDGTDKPYL
ncbi:MAG: aminopeptidase, partial [Cutibacterium granulosum]|nr:aminopeptidase [Cutibacterium granulosum]